MILIQIAGHLGADAETRVTPSGQKVTTLRIATNIRRGQKEKTVWWKVTIWGDRFDRLMPYLKKGTALFVMGDMAIPETYQDREGNTQISLEVTAQFISFNPFGGKSDKANSAGGVQNQPGDDAGMESGYAPAMSSMNSVPRSGAKPSQVLYGAQESASYSDDDIPF